MHQLLAALVVGLFILQGPASAQSSPKVKTTQGSLLGSILYSIPSNRPIYSFRGIPYAQPPVGKLRFKPPVDASPWSGEKSATLDAPECIQKDALEAEPIVRGQEDCLYLNVYTPTLTASTNLLPVMVYIHGGGFFGGSGRSDVLGPEYLLEQNVILVTFNYRLGVLGFLSTGTEHASGNYGLKDQNAALRWVRDNVVAFGGNPQLVTIFGQSAGAASVHFHTLSPLSNGLFHRAILQSGSALCVWASMKSAVAANVAAAQAFFVNCTSPNTEEMVSCLQNVDASVLVDSASNFQQWDRDPMSVYYPIEELSGPENERFLPANAYEQLQTGQVARVPIMFGVVPGEGSIRAGAILSNSTLINDFNTRPNELGPLILGLFLSAEKKEENEIWNNIAQYYLRGANVTSATAKNFLHMYGDRFFLHGIYHAAEMHRTLDIAPVYLYRFSYKGEFSYVPLHAHNESIVYDGAGHCDELIYLFKSSTLFPELRRQKDKIVRDTMVQIWTYFATYGRPAMTGSGWNSLSPCSPLEFAEISERGLSAGRNDFYSARLGKWEELPLLENSLAQPSRIRSASPRKCDAEFIGR